MKVKLYFIPGLGCDHRFFDKLIGLLPTPVEVQCLNHVEPDSPTESIAEYAKRLAATILPKQEEERVILIGFSLGGMIATELNKLIKTDQLVILSSIKHQSERPALFEWATKIPLYRLTPTWFTQNIIPILARWFRFTEKESGILFSKMIKSASPRHIKWGRYAAINWMNDTWPEQYIHIHGTKDHIFNGKSMKVTHWIEGGTHSMIMDRATEVAAIIEEEIAALR